MRLVSYSFLLAWAVLLVVYYRMPGRRQWLGLLAASLGFAATGGMRGLMYLLLTASGTWIAARWIRRNQGRRDRQSARRKNRVVLWLWSGVSLGLLGVCKIRFAWENLLLPLGISYYTFQSLGYLLDLHRGQGQEAQNPLKLLLFLAYFPQLIQGPISRYGQLAPQLLAPHAYDARQVSLGLQRMLWGYFKKLVIADRIAPAVQALRGDGWEGTAFLMLSVCYGIQIYGDFTGGMDIALGMSQALGILLPENFIRPFGSRSVAEYWRRWHITLGQWMKDYVFYPVSVSTPLRRLNQALRKKQGWLGKRVPVYAASAVTWLCTGIWHGITPNFLLWGMLNWAVLLISEELTPLYRAFHRRVSWKNRPWYGCWECARTFFLMNLIRAADLFPNVGVYVHRLGTIARFQPISWGELGLSSVDWGILAAGILLMAAVGHFQEKTGSVRQWLWNRPGLRYLTTFLLFLCVLLMGVYGVGYDPENFIYNQF